MVKNIENREHMTKIAYVQQSVVLFLYCSSVFIFL